LLEKISNNTNKDTKVHQPTYDSAYQRNDELKKCGPFDQTSLPFPKIIEKGALNDDSSDRRKELEEQLEAQMNDEMRKWRVRKKRKIYYISSIPDISTEDSPKEDSSSTPSSSNSEPTQRTTISEKFALSNNDQDLDEEEMERLQNCGNEKKQYLNRTIEMEWKVGFGVLKRNHFQIFEEEVLCKNGEVCIIICKFINI